MLCDMREKTIERYKKLYAAEGGGHLLVKTAFPLSGVTADFAIGYVPFGEYDLTTDEGLRKYFDAVAEKVLEETVCHCEVDDDWIPELFVHLGSGVVETFIRNAELRIVDDTSWSLPSAPFEPGEDPGVSPWVERIQLLCVYLCEKYEGRFDVCANFHYSPLDALNYLRGSEAFLEMHTEPDMTRELLEFSVRRTLELKNRFSTGGHSIWNIWFPEKDGLLIQEDSATLVSPADYLEFGKGYTERLFSDSYGMVHTHMLGIHQFENISSIKNLSMLNISSDPNCKRPADAVGDILEAVKNRIPVYFDMSAEELFNKIEELKMLNAVLWVYCSDKDEASKVTEFVRKHSRIT